MATELPPVPMRSPVLESGQQDPQKKQPFMAVLHREMVRWLSLLRNAVNVASQFVASVSLSSQSAAVATTDVATLPAGLYRVGYSLRITQAATTSSSAQPTLGWTSDSVSCSQAFAAVTGNTTASQSSDQVMVNVDASTPITYSIAYASVGATPMRFSFDLFVEDIP